MRRISANDFDRIAPRLFLWGAVIGMLGVLTWCVY
jgi:hypothetical protein